MNIMVAKKFGVVLSPAFSFVVGAMHISGYQTILRIPPFALIEFTRQFEF